MTVMLISSSRLRKSLLLASGIMVLAPFSAMAANTAPSLIITSDPLPESLKQKLYSKPYQTQEITASDVVGDDYYQPTQTIVSSKVRQISSDLSKIQGNITGLSSNLATIQQRNEQMAAVYYSNVATINTQLQSGTTPGNPRLVGKLSQAENQLENLGASVAELNGVAVESARLASEASFLLEETRAAYSLSGAVEEDHVALARIEDNVHNTLVVIDRILNTVNDDITRTSTYMSSERDNLRTLALGVTNGDLYGKSLATRPFSSAPAMEATPASYSANDSYMAGSPAPAVQATVPGGMRPLAKIKFDRDDVDYEQPIYMAVNEALQRYPDAMFELVAVHPSQGNAAEVAIESTKARRNAEKVLRTLTQMGMPMERIDLSYSAEAGINANEVHLYLK